MVFYCLVADDHNVMLTSQDRISTPHSIRTHVLVHHIARAACVGNRKPKIIGEPLVRITAYWPFRSAPFSWAVCH